MRIGPFEIAEPVPSLRGPHALAMLRPWVDVGSVGTLVLTKLERHLGARPLGKLARPGNFFDFTRYRPTIMMDQGRREIVLPNSFISYAKRGDGPDFLLLHLLEAHMFGEDYAEGILEVLKFFGATRYTLIGAMYDAVPHTRPLLVTGHGGASGKARVEASTYLGPTTINYLISQNGPQFGIEPMSLIAHLPQYVQLEEDYAGAARVLEVLQTLYNLPGTLIEHRRGQAQYEEIARAVSGNPQLLPVIQQLEAAYDARTPREAEQANRPLAPEVEDFLRKIDEQFGNGAGS